jgi:hypothetical protein
MFGIVQRRLRTLAEYEEAWVTPVDVPNFVRELGEPGSLSTESGFQAAAHFIAGSLERSDFKLFRNGGLPLLERRTPPFREEILLRLGPNAVRGAYLPVSLELHICHEGLREIRERYWLGAGRPPMVLVSGNIGLTQQIPTFDIWNVLTEDALSELLSTIRQDVLPFLELLDAPNQLRRAIFDFEAPLFDHSTAIEWLLIEFGRKDARDYVRALIDNEDIAVRDFWSHHDAVKSELGAAIKTGETARNLAVIAVSHDLFRRWLY